MDGFDDLNQAIRRELRFRVDQASGRTEITIVDCATRQVVRHIAAESVLTLDQRHERPAPARAADDRPA